MKPNCRECKHFFVTFNPDMPRGCRAYGIKTASVPSMVVKNANGGADCIGFEAKPKKDEGEKAKDLNDPKYWRG